MPTWPVSRTPPRLRAHRKLTTIPRRKIIITTLNTTTIITPAAAGEAPKGLESTGDPSFCTLWTLCGMPALSLPLMRGGNGLPIGVQLVGARGTDARLLRTARWLAGRVAA